MVLGEDWREAFIDFIRDQRLPVGIDDKSAEVARVQRRSKGFVLVDGKLYRRGARSGVLMKCVTMEDGYDILREIDKGVCGNYAASRTLVEKAYRASFWCIDRRGRSCAQVPKLSILQQTDSCSSP
jgi:hypothetical protein